MEDRLKQHSPAAFFTTGIEHQENINSLAGRNWFCQVIQTPLISGFYTGMDIQRIGSSGWAFYLKHTCRDKDMLCCVIGEICAEIQELAIIGALPADSSGYHRLINDLKRKLLGAINLLTKRDLPNVSRFNLRKGYFCWDNCDCRKLGLRRWLLFFHQYFQRSHRLVQHLYFRIN